MRFIHDGYLIVEGVVDRALNRACESVRGGHLTDFVRSEAFRREVLLQPQVGGAARALLGANFLVPMSAHHHLYQAPHRGQTWHSDGLTDPGYGITHLQCYYYPQAVALEDGPTMILPGSHHRLIDREAIAHYGDHSGAAFAHRSGRHRCALTRYGIWHKAGPKLNATRHDQVLLLPEHAAAAIGSPRLPPLRPTAMPRLGIRT